MTKKKVKNSKEILEHWGIDPEKIEDERCCVCGKLDLNMVLPPTVSTCIQCGKAVCPSCHIMFYNPLEQGKYLKYDFCTRCFNDLFKYDKKNSSEPKLGPIEVNLWNSSIFCKDKIKQSKVK